MVGESKQVEAGESGRAVAPATLCAVRTSVSGARVTLRARAAGACSMP